MGYRDMLTTLNWTDHIWHVLFNFWFELSFLSELRRFLNGFLHFYIVMFFLTPQRRLSRHCQYGWNGGWHHDLLNAEIFQEFDIMSRALFTGDWASLWKKVVYRISILKEWRQVIDSFHISDLIFTELSTFEFHDIINMQYVSYRNSSPKKWKLAKHLLTLRPSKM